MPECDDDYYDNVLTEIDVRRDMVANDALREARKRKFQPSKLLKVRAVISLLYPGAWSFLRVIIIEKCGIGEIFKA